MKRASNTFDLAPARCTTLSDLSVLSYPSSLSDHVSIIFLFELLYQPLNLFHTTTAHPLIKLTWQETSAMPVTFEAVFFLNLNKYFPCLNITKLRPYDRGCVNVSLTSMLQPSLFWERWCMLFWKSLATYLISHLGMRMGLFCRNLVLKQSWIEITFATQLIRLASFLHFGLCALTTISIGMSRWPNSRWLNFHFWLTSLFNCLQAEKLANWQVVLLHRELFLLFKNPFVRNYTLP